MGLFSVALSFSALLFLLIVLIVFNSKKNISSTPLRIFSSMLILTIVGLGIDVLGFITFKAFGPDAIINMIISRLYCVFYFLWGFSFTYYIIYLTFKLNKKFTNLAKIIASILAIIIFLLPIKIFSDGTSTYSYGLGVTVNWIFSFVFVLIMFYCLIKNFKQITKKEYIPLLVYLVLGT